MHVEGERCGAMHRLARLRLLLGALLLAAAGGGAHAGDLYKCGKVFQDRPCETTDVQQRFSRTQGTFAIEQVNPNTDRDCARIASDAFGWWKRMADGEPLDKLHAEVQAQKNTSRYEKSLMRDVLTTLNGYRGTPREVRSQFETQCMAYKRKNGYATEREVADGPARASAGAAQASARMADADARRAEADARGAEMEARRMDMEARSAAARARMEAARSARQP